MQGLFDRHPQVCVIPCLLPFLDLFSRDPRATIARCSDLFRNDIEARYGCMLDHALLERSFFGFIAEFGQFLPGMRFEELQLRAIHFAWSKQCGVDPGDVRVILWHPHRLDEGYKTFLRDLGNKKILLACRAPLDSLISTYRHWVENDMLPMPSAEASDFVRHPWIILYLNNSCETYELYEEFRELGCLVAIEHLNADVEGETQRMSNFLGVDFIAPLLGQSTCMGLPMQQLPGKLVKPISVRTQFQEVVPVNTELLLGRLFGEAAQVIGYPASPATRSETRSLSLVVWLAYSNVWMLAFSACVAEGRRGSARAGAGRIGAMQRAFKYYAQFLNEFFKLTRRLLVHPKGIR